MHVSAFLCSLFVAGALSSPFKRDYTIYDDVIVVKTITTVIDGPEPTSTSAPVILPTSTTTTTPLVPQKNVHHHRKSKTSSTTPVASLAPTSILPSSTSTTPPPPPPEPTSTSTPPPPPPEPTSTSTPPPPPPEPTSTSTSTPPPPPPPTSTPPPSSTSKPPVAPTQQVSSTPVSDGSPLSGGVSLLQTANKFRALYGLPLFKWDSQLESNAKKTATVDDNQGRDEKHHLYPGSWAQVITPGMETAFGDLGGDTPFQLSYAAWLCEVSTDPQLKSGGTDQCALVQTILHMSYSDTGHHDILNSRDYGKIGCAFAHDPTQGDNTVYQGLWVCDLAPA